MKPFILVALLLMQALWSACAHAAWNADWKHRAKVNLDTSASGLPLAAGVDNVAVLLRLHSGNFAFIDAKPDGSDLRFIAADDKTPLKFHIDKFDGVNELALVWVQVPRLNPGNKAESIWLYYGNEKVAPASDPPGSWDTAQSLVFHFAEGQALAQDSTANNNHALRMSALPTASGLIGAGAAFDGKAELVVAASPSLRAGPQGQTLTLWLKPTEAGDATLLRLGEGGSALQLLLRAGRLVAQAGSLASAPSAPLAVGSWQHVALVVQAAGNGAVLYLGGTEVARITGNLPANAGGLQVGSGFKGELDELQVAATARSAEWVKFAAASQGADQKLLTVTAPDAAAVEEDHISYLSILLGAVTLDGWIVIAVLGVMFVVSFWVMFAKFLLVRQTASDNSAFMGQFGRLMDGIRPGQPSTERQSAEQQLATQFGRSPLYRLYAAAVHEMHSRFDAYQASGRELLLNENSLSAIRATVDARLVRELQGLNSKLVVLTVSIAGGPFLGLLGTVVGVMITFAAIAAAGDVNVNAIAPGIAAALVATVAGLAVAIPCLFGYNFLTSRIGELTADLQAFVDELVTRIAENHSS